MVEKEITGTLTVNKMGWHWSVKNLSLSDIEFLQQVNPSSSVSFLRHLDGAEHCEHLVGDRDKKKFLKCLNAVK